MTIDDHDEESDPQPDEDVDPCGKPVTPLELDNARHEVRNPLGRLSALEKSLNPFGRQSALEKSLNPFGHMNAFDKMLGNPALTGAFGKSLNPFGHMNAFDKMLGNPALTGAFGKSLNPFGHMNAFDKMLGNPALTGAFGKSLNPFGHMNAFDKMLGNPALTGVFGKSLNPLRHMSALDMMRSNPALTDTGVTRMFDSIGRSGMNSLLRAYDSPLRGLWSSQASLIDQNRTLRNLAGFGAAQLAAAISPKASPSAIIDALLSASLTALGRVTIAAGQTSSRHVQLAQESLSTLATLALDDDDRGELCRADAPLVEAVVEIHNAIDACRDDVAQLAEAFREIVKYLQGLRQSRPGRTLDLDRILPYIALVVTIYLGIAQLNYASRADDRAVSEELRTTQAQHDDNYSSSQSTRAGEPSWQDEKQCQSGPSESTATTPDACCAEEHVVIREASLRLSKKKRSAILVTLQPGALVVTLAKSGKLVQVEYYDHVHGRKLEGWLHKKYLQRVSTISSSCP